MIFDTMQELLGLDSGDVIRMLIKIIKPHGLFEGHIPCRVEAA